MRITWTEGAAGLGTHDRVWSINVRVDPHPEAPGGGRLRGRSVDYVPWGDGVTTLAFVGDPQPVVQVGDVIERPA